MSERTGKTSRPNPAPSRGRAILGGRAPAVYLVKFREVDGDTVIPYATEAAARRGLADWIVGQLRALDVQFDDEERQEWHAATVHELESAYEKGNYEGVEDLWRELDVEGDESAEYLGAADVRT